MYNERPGKIRRMRHANAHGGVANLEKRKQREASEAVLKHLWVLHAACAKILARWFTEKTEISNEQAESVEHVKVRSTKSKTNKPRLLNTEPLPGGEGRGSLNNWLK